MTLIAAALTFEFPADWKSIDAPNVVTVGEQFVGQIAFEAGSKLRAHAGVSSATPSVSSELSPLPSVGTAVMSGDNQTVLVPFTASPAAVGDYWVSVRATSTDGTIFEMRGKVKIE